jgi:peptidoglycan/xylan/chitin deacetylase (PgdA/CDA1 family)
MRRLKILSVFWHGIRPDAMPPAPDGIDPSASIFREQVKYLIEHYTPITVWDFIKTIDGGDSIRSFAKPPILLAFDDGFRSVIVNGLPILSQFGVPATFFVLGEVLRKQSFVPWYVEVKHMIRKAKLKRVVYQGVRLDLAGRDDGVKARRLFDAAFRACQSEAQRQDLLGELSRVVGVPRPVADEVDEDFRFVTEEDVTRLGASSLLTIASHAMTHRYLATLDYDQQFQELQQSDAILREYSPSYCPVIAYPVGSFNADTIAIARKIYKVGFAVSSGSSYDNYYAYPRIGLGHHTAVEVAYSLSAMRLNWLLPLKRRLQAMGCR